MGLGLVFKVKIPVIKLIQQNENHKDEHISQEMLADQMLQKKTNIMTMSQKNGVPES